MNDEQKKSISEQLSAFYDGELNALEQSEVERQLESSDAVRRELDEFGQLSDLLQSLPKQSVPADFSQSILKQVAQPLSNVSLPPAEHNSSNLSHNNWLKYVVGLVSTVAALFVITLFIPQPENPQNNVALDESSEAKTFSNSHQSPAETEHDSLSHSNLALKSTVSAEGSPSKSHLHVRKNALQPELAKKGAGKSAGAPTAFAKSASGSPGEARMRISPQQELANFRETNWNNVNIGDIVSYQDQSGAQVAVVEVTVVDIHQAVGQMQFLLAKNSIPDVSPALKSIKEESQKPTVSQKKSAYKDIPEHQVALLVTTSKSRLATTFNQLQNKRLFVDLQPQTQVSLASVQVASLDSDRQLAQLAERVLQSNSSQTEEINRRSVSPGEKKDNLHSQKSASVADSASATDKKQPKKSVLAKSPSKTEDAKAKAKQSGKQNVDQLAASYQLLLNLDKPKLVRRESQNATRNEYSQRRSIVADAKPQDLQSKVGQSPAAATKPGSNKLEEERFAGRKQNVRLKRSPRAPSADDVRQKRDISKNRPASHQDWDMLPNENVRVLFVFTKQSLPADKQPIQKARTP